MKVKHSPSFKSEYQQIRDIAAEMYEGQQISGYLCPFCKGGSTGKDRSLSVKRNMITAEWCCHRDECQSKGTCAMVFSAEDSPSYKPPLKKVARPAYQADLVNPAAKALSDLQLDWLNDNYGLVKEDVTKATWLWDNKYNRLWMPIHQPDRHKFSGHVLKPIEKKDGPKNITVLTDPSQVAADWWYRFINDIRLVICEDQISACKIARQFNALALLGTHMGDALVAQIKKYKFREVILILDKDALQTALSHQAKYRELFEDFKVVMPEKDPKYLSNEAIKDLVEGAKRAI